MCAAVLYLEACIDVLRCDNNYTSLASKGNQAGYRCMCVHTATDANAYYIWVEIP